MKQIILVIIAAILGFNGLVAQTFVNQLPNPTVEELERVRYDIDTSAVAVVLRDQSLAQCVSGEGFSYDRKIRVKLLRPEGLDFLANSGVAAVYAVAEGAVVKVSPEQLSVGSVVDYEYHHESADPRHIEPWKPQGDLPVLSALYTLVTPAGYSLEIEIQGNCGMRNSCVDTLWVSSDNGQRFQVCQRQFECRDIPALQKDEFIYCIDDYRFRVTPYVKQIKQPDGSIENLELTWEQVDLRLQDSELLKRFSNADDPIGKKALALKAEGKRVLPVVLRRRSSGRLDYGHPSIDAFDDMILAVVSKADTFYLDPRMPDSIMYILSAEYRVPYGRMLNPQGDAKKNIWLNLFGASEYRVQSNHTFDLGADASLRGDIKMYYRHLAGLDRESRVDSVKISRQLSVVADSITVSPCFAFHIEERALADRSRVLPIDYPYCLNERYNITIRFDESAFEVRHLPDNELILSSSGKFGLQYMVQRAPGKIAVSIIYQRFTQTLYPSSLATARSFCQEVANKCLQTITFVKKQS